MEASCPACGAGDARRWRAAHELERGAPGRAWPQLRCPSCGTAWLADGPGVEARRSLHQVGPYASASGPADRLPGVVGRILVADRVRLIGPMDPGSRVIEVGAGSGSLVSALRERGHDAVGIEPSAPAAESARTRGLPVEGVALEDASFPPDEADVVVLWHALEHLDGPGPALERVASWLRPGGRVVVAAPNLDSLQARIGGDRWFHQDVPRHRTQFTLRGLDALLRRSGLVPGRARHLMLEQNALGMWLTLLNFATAARDVPYRAAKRDLGYVRRRDALRDAAATVLAGPLVLPVACGLELGAGIGRRGGTVVLSGVRRAPVRG